MLRSAYTKEKLFRLLNARRVQANLVSIASNEELIQIRYWLEEGLDSEPANLSYAMATIPFEESLEDRGVYCAACLERLGTAKGGALVKRCASCFPQPLSTQLLTHLLIHHVIGSNATSYVCEYLDLYVEDIKHERNNQLQGTG